MDTLVNVQVVSTGPRAELEASVERALAWFETVERICTRFDPSSEVMQLSRRAAEPVQVSTLLLELVDFALALAQLTDGAFDPTLGVEMEQRGFDVEYRTGQRIQSGIAVRGATYRDVAVDRASHSVTLRQPLVLDLNSVAKGLAIDLAAKELHGLDNFSIEAGGDLYAHGIGPAGNGWRVGIRDPQGDELLAHTLELTDAAVCTSGTYERGQHVLHGQTRESASELASVTVVAPTALAADGFSTAALALGLERGRALLANQGLAQSVFVTADGDVVETA
jgi:thiamine biosynthesis lipoprotein